MAETKGLYPELKLLILSHASAFECTLMKICPSCKRTFEDESYTYCLDDGAPLVRTEGPLPTSPATTRQTNPPKTEIFPEFVRVKDARVEPILPTMAAFPPPTYPSEPHTTANPDSSRPAKWILLGLGLVIVIAALLAGLGYLLFRMSRPSEQDQLRSATPVSSPISVVTSTSTPEPKTVEPVATDWLEGQWEGRGYQTNTKTSWAMLLTVHNDRYLIDYPTEPCEGKWNLVNKDLTQARFVEVITKGVGRCANNGNVMIRKISDSKIQFRYAYAHSKVIVATATLTRKS